IESVTTLSRSPHSHTRCRTRSRAPFSRSPSSRLFPPPFSLRQHPLPTRHQRCSTPIQRDLLNYRGAPLGRRSPADESSTSRFPKDPNRKSVNDSASCSTLRPHPEECGRRPTVERPGNRSSIIRDQHRLVTSPLRQAILTSSG